MGNEIYHIFQVFDYKGGELMSSVNLTYEEACSELTDEFDGLEAEDYSDFDEVYTAVQEIYNDDEFTSIYAGGGGFTGEIYKSTPKGLVSVSFSHFLKGIASLIVNSNV